MLLLYKPDIIKNSITDGVYQVGKHIIIYLYEMSSIQTEREGFEPSVA